MAEFKMSNAFGQTRFDISIAIDFGTDGLGVAYALPNDSRIYVHDKWKSKKYGTIVKPKTIILFDENFEVVNVGLDAKHAYIDLTNQKDKWMLFERFKMSLFDDANEKEEKSNVTDDPNDNEEKSNAEENIANPRKIGIKDELTATNGKKCKSEAVFVAAFKYVHTLCKKYLTKQKIKFVNNNIQWIITVPAIWDDSAKHKMKQWATKAGLVDKKLNNQCKIVYEPDCASLAIQYHMKDASSVQYDSEKKKRKKKKKRHNEEVSDEKDDVEKLAEPVRNYDDFQLTKGDKYILVDVGGGTADVACHEIIDEFGVKEIYHPSGGKWGSTYIDDQYILLLENIFSKEWIEEFKTTTANHYVKLIYNFQLAKKTFYDHKSNKTHNVALPKQFDAFIESKLATKYKNCHQECKNDDNMVHVLKDVDDGEYIEHFIKNCKVFGKSNMLDYGGNNLDINTVVWEKMFNFVVDPIINHIENLLRGPLVSNKFKYICLVGGLSCSKYFRHRIKQQFGLKSRHRLDLIVPFKPILSVVQGAAFLGITPNFVRARRLQYTYGVVVSELKRIAVRNEVDDNYIEKNQFMSPFDKRWRVRGCISVIAGKNEEVSLYKDEKKTETFCRQHQSVKEVVYEIFCSGIKEPKTIDDGKVIGSINITFDDDLKSNDIETEFIFSETVLKVYVWPKDAPNKRYEVEVNYNVDNL